MRRTTQGLLFAVGLAGGLSGCVTGQGQPTVKYAGAEQKSIAVAAVEIYQGPPPPRPWADIGTIEVTCPADAYASGHGSLDVEGGCSMEQALKLARDKLAEVGADGMYAIATNGLGGGRLTGLSGTVFRYEGSSPRSVPRRDSVEPEVTAAGKPVLVIHGGGSGPSASPSSSGVVPSRVPTTQPAATAKVPVEERLRRLQELRDKGLISPEDYEKKKAEILRDL